VDARLNQNEKFSLRAFHDYLWKNRNARDLAFSSK